MGLYAESRAACSPCIAKTKESSKTLHLWQHAGQADLSSRKLSSARQAEAYLGGICSGELAPLQGQASEITLMASIVFMNAGALGTKQGIALRAARTQLV